jgi:putative tricarboxylic transport membrane protein
MRSPRIWTEALISAAVGILGLAMITGAQQFNELRMSVVAGPAVFPMIIGAALVLLSLTMAVELLRGGSVFPDAVTGEEIARSAGWRGILPILSSLVIVMLTVRWIGLVIAGSVLFAGVAIGLRSPRPARDTMIGLAVALGTYFAFNNVLGLPLPGGPLDLVGGMASP